MPTFRGLFVRKDSTRGTTPVEARKALAGLVAPSGAAGARPGLLSGGVVVGTTGWAYAVGAFHAALTRGAADGVVLTGNDGLVHAPCDPAPATGARIDIVYIRHADVDAGDTTSEPVIEVAKGATSGSPVAPTLPVGALEIARATVAAGATSTQHAGVTISQSAPRTALRGTPLPFRDGAARDGYRNAYLADGGIISPASPLPVYRANAHPSQRLEISDGAAFVPVGFHREWMGFVTPGGPVVDTAAIPGSGFNAEYVGGPLPFATRIHVNIAATLGFSGVAADIGIEFTRASAAFVEPVQMTVQPVRIAPGVWANVAHMAYIDLPANTGWDGYCIAQTDGAHAYYRLGIHATRVAT